MLNVCSLVASFIEKLTLAPFGLNLKKPDFPNTNTKDPSPLNDS
ncbi:18473_t:CDS:2, partial [Entrophospora sp. SA101]